MCPRALALSSGTCLLSSQKAVLLIRTADDVDLGSMPMKVFVPMEAKENAGDDVPKIA